MPTILHRLDRWATEAPNDIAQRYKSGTQWMPITAREMRDRVHRLALFLASRGIAADGAGAIYSYNNPQWVQLELALLLLGAREAGIYPNSTPKDIQYILKHTEADVIGVQNKAYFAKIAAESAAELERARLIIVFDGDTSVSPKAVSYDAALAEGRKLAASAGAGQSFKAMADRLDPKAGAMLIYTSGTTGNPKGALLSHDNLVFTADLASREWHLPRTGGLYSFLPLCHVAEQLQNVGVAITMRYTASFATAFENVSKELPEVQPTLLLCVPRVWEKMMEGVMGMLDKSPEPRKRLGLWALGVGSRVAEARINGRMPRLRDLALHPLADRLVLSKIREKLGLAQAEKLASGAAALPAHVARWFRSLGLEILEDFGQTESTGVICMTQPGVDMAGTVGKPVSGIEFKLAEDGEITCRGRNVFVGYFKDAQATAATLSNDGWLHTGDLGAWTDKGTIKIVGRKKEILKTSGGKMVAPMPIEERLKAADIISQACMVGDGRKYLAALITLAENLLKETLSRPGAVDGLVIIDKIVLGRVDEVVEALNRELASYEQIKRFAVLSREFTVEAGEMTPTLKVKRAVIESRYHDVIERLYQ